MSLLRLVVMSTQDKTAATASCDGWLERQVQVPLVHRPACTPSPLAKVLVRLLAQVQAHIIKVWHWYLERCAAPRAPAAIASARSWHLVFVCPDAA